MSSFDGFTTKGFDAFITPGFDARGGSCVATTLVATSQYVWGVGLPSSPSYTLDGDVAFDSLGRLWVAPFNKDDKYPKVYDASGNLLFAGPVQSGRLGGPSDAGQGAAVMVVYDESSDPVDPRINKIACFNSDDASVKWTYTDADANFEALFYVAGIVFARYRDHGNKLPGLQEDPQDPANPQGIQVNGLNPAWRTVALDSETGAVLATVGGLIQAVAPEGGIVVLHNYDDFISDPPDYNEPELREYIRYDTDLSTQLWTRSGNASTFNERVGGVDIDRTGTTWFITGENLISIDPAGGVVTTSVGDNNTASWGVRSMAIDLCASQPRAFLHGSFRLSSNISPNESTLQTLRLSAPSVNANSGNFPSTIDGAYVLINGKWSIYT